MLPNVLVIGAPKCGTTSLHSYLAQHPDVSMSNPKELRYFWRNDWLQSQQWYEGHFRSEALVRGESTPAYSMWPVRRNVPERAARLVPEAKIIYLVRDPIDRLLSHYYQRLADGHGASLQSYIDSAEEPSNVWVCPSRYKTQLERWLAYFDTSQILVVELDDLKVDRASVIAEIFRFLALPESPELDLGSELNRAEDKFRLTIGGRISERIGMWRLSAHVPEVVKAPVRPLVRSRLFSELETTATLDAISLRRLQDHLRPEAEALRELVQRDFANWSV
jgi:hypothetical protein